MDKLVDMKRKPIKESNMAVEPSDYPYGLTISLDSESIKKLGMEELPDIGDEFRIMAVARVKRVSSNDSEGGISSSNVDLQITKMCVSEEDEEGESAEEESSEKGAFSMPGMRAR